MPRRTNRNRISVAVESLEVRRLLSAALNSGGALIVTGDPVNANTISVGISQDGTSVDVAENNEAVQSFQVSQVKRVVIIGGSGNDTLTIDQTNSAFTIPTRIFGGAGDDSIVGGGGKEFLSGGSGDDTIIAGSGTTIVDGGGGNDSVTGGVGDDSIYGGKGADTLASGGGNDYFDGGKGKDVITAGGGSDTLFGAQGHNDLSGGSGSAFFIAGGGHNHINCGSGSDTVNGAGANDQVTDNSGGAVTNDDGPAPAMPGAPDKTPPANVPDVTDVGTISGMVTAPDGSVAAGATVYLCTTNPENGGFTLAGQFATTTDDTGSYTLSNIPAGTYVVLAGQAGVGFVNTTVTVETGQTTTLALGLQALSGTSDDGTGSITGQVTDSQDNPIAGATVKIVRASADASGDTPGSLSGSCITTTTDANGDYSLASVPAGTFEVVAFLAGGGEGETQVTITADQAATGNVTLQQQSPAQNVGTVSGIVVDSNNNPVADASVGLISSESGAAELYASTGADGSFTIPYVLAGTYNFVAGKHSIGLIEIDGITVTAGQTTTEDVTLQSTVVNPVVGTVTGNVVLPDGVTPAAGVSIGLVLKTDLSSCGATPVDPSLTTTTDSSGNFSLANVPAGEYLVFADLPGVGAAKADITVTADPNTPVDMQLVAPRNGGGGDQISVGTVSGAVTDSDGNPVVDASVGLIPATAGAAVIGTESDSNGDFSLTNVPPGTYTLAAGSKGIGSDKVADIVVTANQTTTQNLTLTESSSDSGGSGGSSGGSGGSGGGSGGDSSGTGGTTQGVGSVSIAVVDSSGNPVPSASVGLISSVSGTPIIGGAADANGDITLTNVPAGTYTLEAGVHGVGRAQVIDVVVTADQTTTENLTLVATTD
jgi:hypothetical protein